MDDMGSLSQSHSITLPRTVASARPTANNQTFTGDTMPIDAKQPYDDQNIFAKILRGEIPSKTVMETDHSLAFHDINPLAPIHVLVIPKGPYVSWDDFTAKASDLEIADFVRTVGEVARMTGADAQGYRVLSNSGKRSGQEVPHLHIHVFGGAPLGPMLAR
jgi:histidine triad (HIT) family protein